jgi:heat shock protein HslJ
VSRWVATTIGGTAVVPGTTIDASFADDGRITGTAGCNRYSAPCTRDGERIAIGPTVATRMYCGAPEGIMEQEAAYFAALARASGIRFGEDTLTLVDAGGAQLVSFAEAG